MSANRPVIASVQPVNPQAGAPAKTLIDPRSALLSVLRTWLLYRDQLLWVFCQGTDPDTHPLEVPTLEELPGLLANQIIDLRSLRELADRLAQQLDAERKSKDVIRDALRDLLAAETPKFLLQVDGIPDAF